MEVHREGAEGERDEGRVGEEERWKKNTLQNTMIYLQAYNITVEGLSFATIKQKSRYLFSNQV